VRPDDWTTVRQRTFTEEARRAQIIACAIEVLAELGYSQTSFARIAERADISKSVISYHFASKDELLEQVVRSVYADGARYMIPRIQAQDCARAVLGMYLRSNLEFIRDHCQDIDTVTEIFLNARKSDGADFDTRTMAWAIRNLVDGVTRQRAQDPEFDFDMCIKETAALVDRATRKPAP
jgi:AcrR family transcriptional regulator